MMETIGTYRIVEGPTGEEYLVELAEAQSASTFDDDHPTVPLPLVMLDLTSVRGLGDNSDSE